MKRHIIGLLTLLGGCVHGPVASHYPDPAMHPIPQERAITAARQVIAAHGTGELELCAVDAIVAPLGGYLVDFRGEWVRDGVRYHIVRVGIPDGTEPDRTGPFALIAHGEAWFPQPPDAGTFSSDLEFLGDADAFAAGVCGQ